MCQHASLASGSSLAVKGSQCAWTNKLYISASLTSFGWHCADMTIVWTMLLFALRTCSFSPSAGICWQPKCYFHLPVCKLLRALAQVTALKMLKDFKLVERVARTIFQGISDTCGTSHTLVFWHKASFWGLTLGTNMTALQCHVALSRNMGKCY